MNRPAASTPPDPQLLSAWQQRLAANGAPAGTLLAAVAAEGAAALADHFYDGMLEDPRAARFLDPEQVRDRLKPSLQRWLRELLGARPEDVHAVQQLQEHVGQVHARIGVPVDLVGRGARMLKARMHEGIRRRAGNEAEALEAVIQLDALLDLALESMTRAYARSREAAGELDGSFRLFSLIQNVGTERERQRALLLAWENGLLYALTSEQPGPVENLLLSRSEFGLWFLHKGMASFGDTAETREVGQLGERIDATLRQRLPASAAPAERRALLEDIRGWTAQIRHLVGIMPSATWKPAAMR